MRKENYFVYLIEQLNENKVSYDLLKINNLMYFAVAKSKNGFKQLIFEAWESGPIISSERNDIVHNFFSSIAAYKSYYKSDGKYEELELSEKEAIDYIVKNFGDFTSFELYELTHEDIFITSSPTPWEMVRPNGINYKEEIGTKKIRGYHTDEWFSEVVKNKGRIKEILNGI